MSTPDADHLCPWRMVVELDAMGLLWLDAVNRDTVPTVTIALNMNDVFGYACADAEDVTLDDMPEIHAAWKQYGVDGVIDWVAKRRGQEPIPPVKESVDATMGRVRK